MRPDSFIQWLRNLLCAAVIAIWVISVQMILKCSKTTTHHQRTFERCKSSMTDSISKSQHDVTCFSILGVACWVRDNLNPIIIVAEGTAIGNFYIYSFFPIVFPVLITASCLMLVIGCVGCCGACSDNKVLLGWFFISTLVSLCVEISTGVGGKWGFTTSSDKHDAEYLYENLKSKEWQSTEWINHAWKEVQVKFNCCDTHGTEQQGNYYEAVSSNCLESTVMNRPPCEESLITFLKNTKVLKALPLLAVILGILQFAALIITAKLWMLACVAERRKESDPTSIAIPDARTLRSNIHQSKPLLKNTSVQTLQSSPSRPQSISRYETSSKNLPSSASSSRDLLYNERRCPHCAIKWYDETKLMTSSRFEAEYRRLQVRSNRASSRVRTRYCDKILPKSSSTRLGLHSLVAHPYQKHELIKSASYNSPTDWKSPSLQSVVKHSRHCFSASLPRKKQTCNRRQRRLNYSHNFIQRLSTIRASGVAAESTASSDSRESTQEELGDSRCYNTEVGSSSSKDDKERFVLYERNRKISEPTGTVGLEICKPYGSDYTTL